MIRWRFPFGALALPSEPAQREAERLQRRMEELSRDRGLDRRR